MHKPHEIYCDYDGVLVDFDGGVFRLLGHHYDDPKFATPEGKAERTKRLGDAGEKWWEDLRPMRDYDQLWNFIRNFHPNILTAYAQWDDLNAANSKKGKVVWNSRHTRVDPTHMHIVQREHKKLYAKDPAGHPNVLIDDYIQNIKEWEQQGGIGILHKSAGQTVARLKELGFKV